MISCNPCYDIIKGNYFCPHFYSAYCMLRVAVNTCSVLTHFIIPVYKWGNWCRGCSELFKVSE